MNNFTLHGNIGSMEKSNTWIVLYYEQITVASNVV